jgi:hypothetical protein
LATLILGAAGPRSAARLAARCSAATIGGMIGSTVGAVVDSWIVSRSRPVSASSGSTAAHHLADPDVAKG